VTTLSLNKEMDVATLKAVLDDFMSQSPEDYPQIVALELELSEELSEETSKHDSCAA